MKFAHINIHLIVGQNKSTRKSQLFSNFFTEKSQISGHFLILISSQISVFQICFNLLTYTYFCNRF